MTPTASSKSLIYNIPVIESIMENPEYKALYLFPLKGLEQDQVKNFNELFYSLRNDPNSFKSLHSPLAKGGRGRVIEPAEIYDVDTIASRRNRLCRYWGSHPQFIAASATIANPSELAEELTGLPFKTVEQSGAPRAGRYFVFVNPLESPYTETMRLFIQCLEVGLRTIVL